VVSIELTFSHGFSRESTYSARQVGVRLAEGLVTYVHRVGDVVYVTSGSQR